MVGLESISTYELIEDLETSGKFYEASILRAFEIFDYAKLNDFFTGKDKSEKEIKAFSMCDKTLLNKRMKKALFLADSIKNGGKITRLYICDNCNRKIIDNATLVKTDQEVLFSDLILYNPFVDLLCRYKNIEDKNVSEIRYMLEHIDFKGNSLILHAKTVGEFFADKIKDAVEFYDQQVFRQFIEGRLDRENLFFANKEQKANLVINQLPEIVNYLVNNAQECRWGEMTEPQKKAMVSMLTSNGKFNLKIKEELVNIFSNYTTLSELETGMIQSEAIDRFIVR